MIYVESVTIQSDIEQLNRFGVKNQKGKEEKVMKRIALITCTFLCCIGLTIPCDASQEYDSGIFTFTYDESLFTVDTSDDSTVSIQAINMPDYGERHNTVLGCLSTENNEYYNLGTLSDTDLQDFKKTFTKEMCTGLFDVDNGISIITNGYTFLGDSCEYFMVLSDATECYVTVYNYGETVYYSVCRLCSYTASLNDGFRSIYRTIKLSGTDSNEFVQAESLSEKIGEVTDGEPETGETNQATQTMGQKNALGKAESYLKFSAFSYQGLIEQLEYSQFSHDDAVYAADNCGANWNEQAVKKAESYLSFSSFSRDGLIEQLEYSGFTHEQAVYAADAVGY